MTRTETQRETGPPPQLFAAAAASAPAELAPELAPAELSPIPALSVIVPFKDEQDNLEPLLAELTAALSEARLDYEIVFVDDGSADAGLARLKAAAAGDPRVTLISLRRNFGQTAALAAGLDHCRGRVIVPIDADLQNDPRDIPRMLEKLHEGQGYDIVSGWRRRRRDRWVDRRLPSQIANWVIRRVTGVPIHDFGCTLKAYRREVLDGVSLYSEMHRLLPALAAWGGARITELVVHHRPRVHGRTKYGLRRTMHVLLDLVTVTFLGAYMTKPLYFFGKIALASGVLAAAVLAVAVAQKFGHLGQPQGLNLNRNVLVPLAALLAFSALQCVLFGVVAELLVRIYHDTRRIPTYRIRDIFRPADPLAGLREKGGST